MMFEEAVCKLAADIAAISPAVVKKAVDALARSSRACAAADAFIHLFLGTLYVIVAAIFFDTVAVRVCGGDYAARSVLSEITGCIFTASLLLSAPAFLLFFLRAAGSSSELAEGLLMKDFDERLSCAPESPPSPLGRAAARLFAWSFWLGFISWTLQLCGLFPEISDLLDDASNLGIWSCFALIYLRAGMALRRMNPRPSDIIAAEADHAASPTQLLAGFRAGSSKVMGISASAGSAAAS
ncbi:hypothetical protein VPH35_125469 [Triticum aestivum]|uniref:uncharacterized protein n=1 Tax=Triticum aestivum TaxID=4565 RepID=UPI000843A235|nr:uncharacterized protein LOC123154442 [Triticum aestivum]